MEGFKWEPEWKKQNHNLYEDPNKTREKRKKKKKEEKKKKFKCLELHLLVMGQDRTEMWC